MDIVSLRGVSGIYQITCFANRKIYIGSAVNLGHRWTCHLSDLRLGIHNNRYLQRAWNKHGEKAFEFNVLEFVPDKAQLLKREQFWIDWFEASDRTVGFNICIKANSSLGIKRSPETKLKCSLWQTGKKLTPEQREKIRQAHLGKAKQGRNGKGLKNFRAVEYAFISPDGMYYSGKNIWEFCRQMGLPGSAMSDIHHGYKLSYKGWTSALAGHPPDRNKEFCFQSPDGKLYVGRNITAFAREHGLNFSLLAAVHRGKIPHHKGWTKVEQKPKQLRLNLDRLI